MAAVCIDRLLETVEKPTRYIGGEYNSVHKGSRDVEIRFAFAFPDVYEIGMSHLGLRILYYLINQREDTWCERVFAPWSDMEEIMRREDIPLFALESRDPVKEFDLIGFTLQYEMSYTNVLNMLNLAGIPQLSRDRGLEHPFVIGGGPCAYNSEPLADFFDFFVLGEGEEVIGAVLDLYKQWKSDGKSRGEFLEMAAGLEGVYVPSLYSVEYNSNGTVKGIAPLNGSYPARIKKVIIEDFDAVYFPDRIIVPYMDIVHDRAILELFRGCTRGCRFCQAGMVYRPVREKKPETLMRQAEKLIESTGYEEISLASLSTSDYTQLSPLVRDMIERFGSQGVGISLPSLRIDSFSLDLINEIQKVRKTGLTFAPEAGTQRLRDVINKGVTEEDLLESVGNAFRCGYSTVKLYFMVGLPTETIGDVKGIKDLAYRVIDRYYEADKQSRGKGLKITVSTSCFVPKPFTPFQWEPQDTMELFNKKQDFLKQELRHRAITYNWHQPETSFLEAVFARGDRRLCKVLLKAWGNGCRFDGWMEHFNFKAWMEAFRECGVDPDFYALRRRDYDEFLPWDHIDIGVSKEFLVSEHKKALEGKTTPHCRDGCVNCGITKVFGGGVCDAIGQS
ncbi:MAG: Fe-S oxidoreductase [Firmicutes bacterium]|nr:Fe-S oxidoreductase [Bacillota bacterium]